MHILGLLFLSLVKRIKAPQREVPDLIQPLLRYLSSCFLISARSMGYFRYHLLSSNTESVTGSILYLIFLSKGMPGCSKKSLNLPKINFQCKSSIPGPLVFSHPPPVLLLPLWCPVASEGTTSQTKQYSYILPYPAFFSNQTMQY